MEKEMLVVAKFKEGEGKFEKFRKPVALKERKSDYLFSSIEQLFHGPVKKALKKLKGVIYCRMMAGPDGTNHA